MNNGKGLLIDFAALGIGSDEQLKELGMDADMLRSQFTNREPDRQLVEVLFPELMLKNDPRSVMTAGNAQQIIGKWRRTYLGKFVVITRAADAAAEHYSKENKTFRDLLEKAADEIKSLKSQLHSAVERNGLYSTKEKEELAAKTAHVEKLKRDAEGAAIVREADLLEIERLKTELRVAQQQMAEAKKHHDIALEKLSDRYPKPPAYFANILAEMREGIRLLTTNFPS